MMLFERVKAVASSVAESQTALARELGLSQSKFNGYLNAKSQKNLWEHLPKILEDHPEISRDWLYFGEGPMLLADCGHRPAHIDKDLLVQVVELLEEALAGAQKILPPKDKAVVIAGLYELMLENEDEKGKPLKLLRAVNRALAKTRKE